MLAGSPTIRTLLSGALATGAGLSAGLVAGVELRQGGRQGLGIGVGELDLAGGVGIGALLDVHLLDQAHDGLEIVLTAAQDEAVGADVSGHGDRADVAGHAGAGGAAAASTAAATPAAGSTSSGGNAAATAAEHVLQGRDDVLDLGVLDLDGLDDHGDGLLGVDLVDEVLDEFEEALGAADVEGVADLLAGDGHDIGGAERGVDAALLAAEVHLEDLLAEFGDGLLGNAGGGGLGRCRGSGTTATTAAADAQEVPDDPLDLAGAEVLEGDDADVLLVLARPIDQGEDLHHAGHVSRGGAYDDGVDAEVGDGADALATATRLLPLLAGLTALLASLTAPPRPPWPC